jgi:hypothetical protein
MSLQAVAEVSPRGKTIMGGRGSVAAMGTISAPDLNFCMTIGHKSF